MLNWHSKLNAAFRSFVAAVLTVGVASPMAASAADSSSSSSERYTWSAELVAFDAASNMLTARAMVVSNPETDLSALEPGDKAMLTWSGLWTAAGVRAVERGTRSSYDRLTMPIEFVALEHDGRYLSFKVPVPADNAAAIAKLEPGEYVTATSPLSARNAADAVISIKPYVEAG